MGKIPIKHLLTTGVTALVSWQDKGRERRGLLPVTVVYQRDELPAELLARSVPYGLPWAEMFPDYGVKLEDALHDADLWTKLDVMHHPLAAIAVVAQFKPLDLSVLLTEAENFGKAPPNQTAIKHEED